MVRREKDRHPLAMSSREVKNLHSRSGGRRDPETAEGWAGHCVSIAAPVLLIMVLLAGEESWKPDCLLGALWAPDQQDLALGMGIGLCELIQNP